jgi:RNA polymerase sigma-70 factor, ECF subfamily
VVRLKAALQLLTDDQRDVVMLRYAAGLGNDEAARVLGRPVSAVKSLHHRAIGALRRALNEAEEPAPEDGGAA